MTALRGVNIGVLLALLLLVCPKTYAADAASKYYWSTSPVDGSAELVTLFCRGCMDVSGGSRDTPLVAALRDTLGDTGTENDRLSYVWLLTYTQPSWEKRALSAVPFFYWKVGDGQPQVRGGDIKPIMNLTEPRRSVVSTGVREILQYAAFDPLSMAVRASTREFQNNRLDHERLHIDEAESYLQSAPPAQNGDGLTPSELNLVIARLELRKSMLGDFVDERRSISFGENANIALERTRVRNWELLRQCADKTGLLFEAIDLGGATAQYAVLWYPVDRAAAPRGSNLGPVWKLLNIKNPYPRREQLLEKPRYLRSFDGREVEVVPLGVYSLTYPKMPLLMIDFQDGMHLRKHELTQRAITEITSGIIGVSHFTNWYYFLGADLYDFWASRRGTAMNLQERLNCYSKFRVALALDQNLDMNLRQAMQQRVSAFGVNPLETAAQKELQAALQRYDLLQKAAANDSGPLVIGLDKDRRSELARFEANKSQEVRGGVFHYATLGLYSPRAKGDDILARLNRYREAEHLLDFLDGLSAAGTRPEVAYDRVRIQEAVAELTSAMSGIDSQAMNRRAQRTIETLANLSEDEELKTQCRAANDFLRQGARESARSAVAEGSGTPETLR